MIFSALGRSSEGTVRRYQSANDDDTINQVETTILECRCIIFRQLAHDVKISIGSVDKIIYDLLHILITQHEIWVHHYDQECKTQSKQWKHFDSSRPEKARVTPSSVKDMFKVY
nr:uncharacterized protein LOC113829250 [Penaeus vannamei]